MKVIAAAGLLVPTEQNPRQYITPEQAVEIEVSAYYLRRLADNELVEFVQEAAGQAANPTTGAAKTATKAEKATQAAA
jgi:hypothetical protein